MVMDGSLQKYDKGKDKWIKVKFDPDNEEHVNIKMQHYAQAEIDFVHETLELGLRVFREINQQYLKYTYTCVKQYLKYTKKK